MDVIKAKLWIEVEQRTAQSSDTGKTKPAAFYMKNKDFKDQSKKFCFYGKMGDIKRQCEKFLKEMWNKTGFDSNYTNGEPDTCSGMEEEICF